MPAAEFELSVACCRWNWAGDGAERIRHLSNKVDWPRFLHVARRHGVQRLAGSALQANSIFPPAPVGDELTRDILALTERNLRSAQVSASLLAACQKAGLPVLFVKGLSLSALAFGDPFLKNNVDVDILVDRRDLRAVSAILAKMGFQAVIPAVQADSPDLEAWHERRKESAWLNSETGLSVDLHTGLSDNPTLIPGIGMNSPTQSVEITSQLALPTLATDELFAYLCVHGTWSAWYRLKWIADVAALLWRSGHDEALHFYDRAIRSGAGRAPAVTLLVADGLFGIGLPADMRHQLERDSITRLLARICLRELRQKEAPPDRAAGTLLMHLMRPLILRGAMSKLSEVKRQLHDVALHATLQH